MVLTDLGIKAWDNPKGDALKKLIPDRQVRLSGRNRRRSSLSRIDAAAMVNGADLVIDGGYTIK